MAFASTTTAQTDLVTINILVGGKEINAAYQIVSIMVTKKVNGIPMAKIQILDGGASQESFSASESTDFVPGNSIQIKAGYYQATTVIFSGVIIKQSIKTNSKNPCLFIVDCSDESVKMTIGRKNACHQNTTDTDVIKDILASYGLTADVSPTGVPLKEIVQYYCTDWDFVLSRADINGQILLTDHGKITVKKPDTSLVPVLELEYGQTILGFDLEMDARNQLSSVQSSSWDISTQSIVSATSQNTGLALPGNISTATLASVAAPSTFNLQSGAAITQESLQNWANAKNIKSALAKIMGTVTFQGSPLANPGVMISLKGLGSRFDGNAFVSGVSHQIENGNWTTQATIGISPAWVAERHQNMVAPAASGLLPGIQGLQIGIVSKIEADPEGQFRVLVKIPIVDPAGEGVWARLASFYATNNAGGYFYPEIGNEVVLGFLNDDPGYPIILGSLFSNTKTPPYMPDDINTYKAIVTNAQLKIEFDDVKKNIRIVTPANNIITLSDDQKTITVADQNSNKITLSPSGISVNSASDIEIKATGNITLSAGGNTTISATGNTNVTGLDVLVKADVTATVQGGASALLTAPGEVTVKGAMVMIN